MTGRTTASRRLAWIAGLALLATTDLVALGGVAWNRSGDPEAVLTLTQRELEPPYAGLAESGNSGLALRLRWRVEGHRGPDPIVPSFLLENDGLPDWLDATKMAALGFDTALPTARRDPVGSAPYLSQPAREVLLVLEVDGPAYRRTVEFAARAASAAAAAQARETGAPTPESIARQALVPPVDALDAEIRKRSRLFVVDAGLDRDALRRRYPDRTHYAILRGRVGAARAHREGGLPPGPAGYIEALSTDTVNVPQDLRHAIEPALPAEHDGGEGWNGAFTAQLAVGRRLEPWLVTASPR